MRIQKIIFFFIIIIFLNTSFLLSQESESPLYVIMNFTANCHSAEYRWEQIDGLIKNSHTNLLNIIEKHPKVKIHFSPTGFTADIYNLFFPVAKNRWQKAVEQGKVSI